MGAEVHAAGCRALGGSPRGPAGRIGPRRPSAALSLAGTAAAGGGEVLLVEAACLPGRGKLQDRELAVLVVGDGAAQELHLPPQLVLEVEDLLGGILDDDEDVLRHHLVRLESDAEGEQPQAGVGRRETDPSPWWAPSSAGRETGGAGSTASAGDVRHVVRGLRRSLGFTVVVVGVLGLGIGASTAVFSVVYGVVVAPLPFRDPAQLVTVQIHIREMEDRFPAFPAGAGCRDVCAGVAVAPARRVGPDRRARAGEPWRARG